MVPQSSDFTVTWTGGMANAVDDLMVVSAGSGSNGTIHCDDVPDTAGSITVPSALLANLPKGTLTIALTRIVTATATGANVTVTIQAPATLAGLGTLQ
jgi:hypothetical protein